VLHGKVRPGRVCQTGCGLMGAGEFRQGAAWSVVVGSGKAAEANRDLVRLVLARLGTAWLGRWGTIGRVEVCRGEVWQLRLAVAAPA
jgi:hypothetical protein